MSIVLTIPVSSQCFLTANIFSAAWNVITPGRYDFTQTPGNQNQTILAIQPRSIYFIDRVSFSANCPENLFQDAIDPTLSLPQIQLRKTRDGQQTYPRKQPFIKFFEGLELNQFFESRQADDILTGSMEAVMTQPAGLIGKDPLQFYVQFTIYQISDQSWLQNFYSLKTDLGEGLQVRGRR